MLDKNTFGGTPAAETLVKIANEFGDEKISKKISKLFTQYSQGAHGIFWNVKDKKLRAKLLSLWLREELKKVAVAKIPLELRSYLCNIEKTLYRKMLRGEFDDK